MAASNVSSAPSHRPYLPPPWCCDMMNVTSLLRGHADTPWQGVEGRHCRRHRPRCPVRRRRWRAPPFSARVVADVPSEEAQEAEPLAAAGGIVVPHTAASESSLHSSTCRHVTAPAPLLLSRTVQRPATLTAPVRSCRSIVHVSERWARVVARRQSLVWHMTAGGRYSRE